MNKIGNRWLGSPTWGFIGVRMQTVLGLLRPLSFSLRVELSQALPRLREVT